MPAGVSALVPLANITTSSATSVVTFTSISQLYRDLILIVQCGQSVAGSAENLYLRYNANTSGYNQVSMGNAFATNGGSSTSSMSGEVNLTDWGAKIPNTAMGFSAVIQIFDYSATDKHKTALTRSGGQHSVGMSCTRWANTAAITEVRVNSSNLFAGATFALYGVSA